MGRWLELFRTLTNSGIDGLTDSDTSRHTDGALFCAGDFSMIECCVLLALAGQQDKCELIAQGVDVYRDMAATIYGLDRAAFMAIPEDQLSPEETEQRRIGKNGVLSSGYGIGVEGFYRRFCRNVEDGRELAARIVGVYRNQWAPSHRDDGAPGPRLVVVDRPQDVLLPRLQLKRLANELALGNEAHGFDKRDHVGRRDRPGRRRLLTRPGHRSSWPQYSTVSTPPRRARTAIDSRAQPSGFAVSPAIPSDRR